MPRVTYEDVIVEEFITANWPPIQIKADINVITEELGNQKMNYSKKLILS